MRISLLEYAFNYKSFVSNIEFWLILLLMEVSDFLVKEYCSLLYKSLLVYKKSTGVRGFKFSQNVKNMLCIILQLKIKH